MPAEDTGSKKRSVNLTDRIEHFKYAFENAQNLAEFADSKANTLLTIHALIITLASAVVLLEDTRAVINTWVDIVILMIVFAVLMISAALSIGVVLPREATSEKSLFYYETIGNFNSSEEYFKSFEQLDELKIAEALANQTYEVSRIVTRKMRLVRYSLFFLIAYLILLIAGSVIIVFA